VDREAVIPAGRDGVVTEDERPATDARHRPQIIQPMKMPKASAAPNITTVPKIRGTYGANFDRSGGVAIRPP
jgi:hypothetical protein